MASEDSEKIDTMESETEQVFPGQKRRPRLSMDELISLNDFKESQDTAEVQQKYAKKVQLNQYLNETYVTMEKAEEIRGWNSRKKRMLQEWKNILEYQFIVNWFFLYQLKRKEGFWSWLIIVISTITSTLSLTRPTNQTLGYITEGSISTFSVITTLIAAWVKKCNYVDRIKNIDRYIQNVSNLNIKIEYILSKPAWERIPYDKFSEAYEDKITSLVAENPPMSPQEFKTTVWQLTKFYPELVRDTYPWYYKDKEGKHVMTEWGSTILDTYEAVYYSAWWRRICSCYYCMCKCWDCKSCSCKETDNYIRSVYETEINTNEIRSLPADPETSLMLTELKKARRKPLKFLGPRAKANVLRQPIDLENLEKTAGHYTAIEMQQLKDMRDNVREHEKKIVQEKEHVDNLVQKELQKINTRMHLRGNSPAENNDEEVAETSV